MKSRESLLIGLGLSSCTDNVLLTRTMISIGSLHRVQIWNIRSSTVLVRTERPSAQPVASTGRETFMQITDTSAIEKSCYDSLHACAVFVISQPSRCRVWLSNGFCEREYIYAPAYAWLPLRVLCQISDAEMIASCLCSCSVAVSGSSAKPVEAN